MTMSKKPLRYFARQQDEGNKPKQEDARQLSQQEDEDEDYMSMAFEEPAPSRGKETYAQRVKRKQRESEIRGRLPSKAEQKAQEDARRHAALSSSITNPANKGFQMMAKLGYKPGMALGKPEDDDPGNVDGHASDPARVDNAASSTSDIQQKQQQQQQRLLEPLSVVVKDDRGGIGMDSEKKRKAAETLEQESAKRKAEEADYRERVRAEREEARFEGIFRAAQGIIENLEQQAEEEEESLDCNPSTSERLPMDKRPLEEIDIVLRGLIKSRRENKSEQMKAKEQFSRRTPPPLAKLSAGKTAGTTSKFISGMKKDLKLPGTFDDMDADDRIALGNDPIEEGLVSEIDDEDTDLAKFNELSAGDRFHQANMYLREKFSYCFWCKCRYQDAEELEKECPGVGEEDHD